MKLNYWMIYNYSYFQIKIDGKILNIIFAGYYNVRHQTRTEFVQWR